MSNYQAVALADATAPGGYSEWKGTNGIGALSVVNAAGVDILSNAVSTVNSSTATLGAGGVFTGVAEDITKYGEVRVTVFSNVASATDGLQLQQSSDGTNWDGSDAYTIAAAGNSKTFGAGCAMQFFRVVYTNGGTIQGTFRLQTTYHVNATKPSAVRPQDGRTNETDMTENMSYLALFNGVGWDRQRTPNKWVTLNAVSIATETTIWTPAAGKRFRLMGYQLTSGTVGGNVLLKDNTAGATISLLPFGAASQPMNNPDMANGYLSVAVNNVLTATGTATQTISGYLYGCEE